MAGPAPESNKDIGCHQQIKADTCGGIPCWRERGASADQLQAKVPDRMHRPAEGKPLLRAKQAKRSEHAIHQHTQDFDEDLPGVSRTKEGECDVDQGRDDNTIGKDIPFSASPSEKDKSGSEHQAENKP